MFKRLNSLVITALFTSAALVAFAFYQRQGAMEGVSPVAFYVAAAIICVMPSLYGFLRHRGRCQNKMPGIN
jgi:hypothetical protein